MDDRFNFKRILRDYMDNANEEIKPDKDLSKDTDTLKDKESKENETAENYRELEVDELIELLDERERKIAELENELAEAQDGRLRKVAELENYRKRMKRERTKIYDQAKANALEDFLSVNDDLTRTLSASEDLEVNQTFLEGVTLVANKFDEVLQKHGVERIDQEGVPFNVDLHDALMRQKPDDESTESDTVLKIIENGYKIGDRIIRHAKVIVSE